MHAHTHAYTPAPIHTHLYTHTPIDTYTNVLLTDSLDLSCHNAMIMKEWASHYSSHVSPMNTAKPSYNDPLTTLSIRR